MQLPFPRKGKTLESMRAFLSCAEMAVYSLTLRGTGQPLQVCVRKEH